jgi:glutamyl-tRNA reductase
MDSYLLISFSHKNTNIVDRDKISFQDNEKMSQFMNRSKSYLSEIMILNTCNRVEFFCTTTNIVKGSKALIHDISQYSGIEFDKLEEIGSVFSGREAIHHLFSVVSSLQSLVIGETQIVGQIKDAFRFSFENSFAGQKISRAVHYSFRTSAQVRSETAISKKKVSIASVSVSKAEELMGTLQDVEALVIGSGEMSRLIAQYLQSAGGKVTLINRTRSKAKEIADEVSGVEVRDFVELEDLLNEKPLLFSATSSEEPIINQEIVKQKNFERYWFDLAVPKDIEDCGKESVNIFRIDDLQESVRKNELERREEIASAYRIVGESTGKFFQWTSTLSIEPLIKNIYLKAEESVKSEVERAVGKGYIEEDIRESVERVAEQSIKKLLHGMSKKLKNISHDTSADMVIESINYLFDFETLERDKMRDSYKCDHAIQHENSIIGIKTSDEFASGE